MSLKNLKLPTEVVNVPGGGSFTVRGLALADITAIVRGRGPQIRALFDQYAGRAMESIGDDDLNEIGSSLLEMAPEIAAVVIAHASEYDPDPDTIGVAALLPFPVQLDAIEKIGKLTFDAEGGPKKVVETVIRVMQGTTNLMADMRVSTAGSLQ